MHFAKKDFFTIPNIMGYFRILLVPVFAALYLRAETTLEYRVAALVLGVSSLTDMFDGLVARKFNMITELGKLLDPLADKLTHAGVAICLATRHWQVSILVVLLFLKEITQARYCWVKYKKTGKKLSGAQWYGKLCTAILFVVFVAMIWFPQMSAAMINGLTGLCAVLIVMAWLMYMNTFRQM
ncbi:MAG: CDP-alcohol phosphatidyltransferase family protein [Lachnospiraceae bacterium]|nr:CDP-alcohol phosphatidyltransferase family protein [Lachnospiraceae bacterium]